MYAPRARCTCVRVGCRPRRRSCARSASITRCRRQQSDFGGGVEESTAICGGPLAAHPAPTYGGADPGRRGVQVWSSATAGAHAGIANRSPPTTRRGAAATARLFWRDDGAWCGACRPGRHAGDVARDRTGNGWRGAGDGVGQVAAMSNHEVTCRTAGGLRLISRRRRCAPHTARVWRTRRWSVALSALSTTPAASA